ncbi:hypothetical protein GCM10009564_08990 [Streptomyces thermogriseus]|uniref:Uncharacterized protein n=1 Tax=Streptomyces thermogriseus TaxID=75292 RepID=A0ABN1SU15_9ACTN
MDGVDLVLRRPFGGPERVDARVVHQEVDPAAPQVHGPPRQLPHRRCLAQIRGDEVGLAAVVADGRDHGLAAGAVAAVDQDMGAPLGQQHRGRGADAAGRPGHQGHAPGQFKSTHEAVLRVKR